MRVSKYAIKKLFLKNLGTRYLCNILQKNWGIEANVSFGFAGPALLRHSLKCFSFSVSADSQN